jgi:hypothetical protein
MHQELIECARFIRDFVMPGLSRASTSLASTGKFVDGRDEPGHDELYRSSRHLIWD